MRIFLAMKENANFIRLYNACATSFGRNFLAMKENSIFHNGLRFGNFQKRGAHGNNGNRGKSNETPRIPSFQRVPRSHEPYIKSGAGIYMGRLTNLRNRGRIVNFSEMKTAIFLTLIVCCLFMPAFAQSKTKTAAPPPPANPYQEADNLFTFGDDAGRDKQSMGVIERGLAANG